jgi:glycosyltransferase involved in cell wall biosynthesis
MRTSFRYRRDLLLLADAVVAQTETEAHVIRSVFGVRGDRVHVIPNAVDPLFGNASPIEFRERYGAETFVLAVGAIDARKRQLDLVEAIAQTGKRAVIVGDVPGDDYGRAFASKVAANHNIVWIRRLEEGSHMLASAYAAAEAFVVTSRAEGLPLAALEAREAGAPLVMTDLPQHVEVFGGGAEFFRPGDVKALAGILERLPPRGKGPIQSAARTWTWTDLGLAMRQVYAEVCPEVVPTA